MRPKVRAARSSRAGRCRKPQARLSAVLSRRPRRCSAIRASSTTSPPTDSVEGLARRLQARGVLALAVAWGGIEDAATSREMSPPTSISRSGPLRASISARDRARRPRLDPRRPGPSDRRAGCAIARIDWAMAKRELAAVRTPTFGAIGASSERAAAVDGAAIVERLRALPPDEAIDAPGRHRRRGDRARAAPAAEGDRPPPPAG